jgi:putative molybdopterin biosynthesis protein
MSSLRELRSKVGLSQQELADAVGVSRQAIAGLEAEKFEPSLKVALKLARTLGVTVEELFGSRIETAVLDAGFNSAGTPRRVDLARVSDRIIALPRHGDNAMAPGFRPVAALVEEVTSERVKAALTRPLRTTLSIAGCDPALPLLTAPLNRLDPPVDLLWWSASNGEALDLLAKGLVHVAGVHLASDASSLVRLAELHHQVLAFARWREGVVFRGDDSFGSFDDLLRRGRLVNRQQGSEARRLIEQMLETAGISSLEVPGWNSSVSGHMLVASSIASGNGDWGIASEAVAIEYGLRFDPVSDEIFVLIVPSNLVESPEVRALVKVLQGQDLRSQLMGIPGYNGVDSCGELLISP